MPKTLETMQVENPKEPGTAMWINVIDFDEEVHKKWPPESPRRGRPPGRTAASAESPPPDTGE